jgi:hypothetical protein
MTRVTRARGISPEYVDEITLEDLVCSAGCPLKCLRKGCVYATSQASNYGSAGIEETLFGSIGEAYGFRQAPDDVYGRFRTTESEKFPVMHLI